MIKMIVLEGNIKTNQIHNLGKGSFAICSDSNRLEAMRAATVLLNDVHQRIDLYKMKTSEVLQRSRPQSKGKLSMKNIYNVKDMSSRSRCLS